VYDISKEVTCKFRASGLNMFCSVLLIIAY